MVLNGGRGRTAAGSTLQWVFGLVGLGVVSRATLVGLENTLEELQRQGSHDRAMIEQLQHQRSEDSAVIEQLTTANQDLRQIAAEYQLKLERGLDYQLIMAQDQIRAGMRNLEPEFLDVYGQCREYTMTSWERLYALYKAVQYIVGRSIPGDLVECGVWRGGSMRLAAMTLMSLGVTDRRLYLYDTFEGMTEPDAEVDVDLHGNRAVDDWVQIKRRDVKWSYAPIEDVWETIASTGYPMTNVVCVKGSVDRTLPDIAPERVSLLRLDTDWYASTKHEIEHLYPRLSPEGVLILDDYGHYRGAQRAIDEYFGKEGKRPFIHRTDYSCRCAIKPAT